MDAEEWAAIFRSGKFTRTIHEGIRSICFQVDMANEESRLGNGTSSLLPSWTRMFHLNTSQSLQAIQNEDILFGWLAQ